VRTAISLIGFGFHDRVQFFEKFSQMQGVKEAGAPVHVAATSDWGADWGRPALARDRDLAVRHPP
jgi:hypothetical protein